jgi:hypothetical protein
MDICVFQQGMACLGGFVVTVTFLDLVQVLNTYGTFWLFAIVSAVAVVFTFLFVPETKGRPLLEIQKAFANKSTL